MTDVADPDVDPEVSEYEDDDEEQDESVVPDDMQNDDGA